jgi:hypothetical protein
MTIIILFLNLRSAWIENPLIILMEIIHDLLPM